MKIIKINLWNQGKNYFDYDLFGIKLSRINIGVREEKNSGADNSLTDIEGNFPGNLSKGWGGDKIFKT
jgi:hypothetical protein